MPAFSPFTALVKGVRPPHVRPDGAYDAPGSWSCPPCLPWPPARPPPTATTGRRLRVPPQSVEAEQSVLGPALLDNPGLRTGRRPAHRQRLLPLRASPDLRRIGNLVNATRPDVITVFEQLQRYRQGGGAGAGLPERARRVCQRCQPAGATQEIVRERHSAQADRRERRHRLDGVQSAGTSGGADPPTGRGQIFRSAKKDRGSGGFRAWTR